MSVSLRKRQRYARAEFQRAVALPFQLFTSGRTSSGTPVPSLLLPAMSLLRYIRLPPLRSFTRPGLAAVRSLAYLPSAEPQPRTAFEDNSDLMPDYPEEEPLYDDDLPPVGSAYGAAMPNPIAATRLAEAKEGAVKERERNKRRYKLYVSSDNNNNYITFTDPEGRPILTTSGGQVGFKHKSRGTPEAGHQCALKVVERIQQEIERQSKSGMILEVLFSGFGRGRDAVTKVLMSQEATPVRNIIWRVTDRTPIKIGGTRSKKPRRM
jgi:small subunit ribosomal protein S11